MKRRSAIILAIAVAFALGVGATSFCPPSVYSSGWWFILWAVVGIGITISLFRSGLRRSPAIWTLHLSLLLIICGGGVTALTSHNGSISMHTGDTAGTFTSPDGKVYQLPVRISLISFDIERYPGMTFPRDFISRILTQSGDTVIISMNHIGHISHPGSQWDDYRIYQTSCTPNGSTVLTVSHDPVGIPLTYAGYILFAIGGLWTLISTGKNKSRAIIAAIILFIAPGISASVPVIPESTADSLETCQILFRGRVTPFGAMADKVSLLLTGSTQVAGVNSTRFIASLMVYREQWKSVPFIKIKEMPLKHALDVNGDYIAPEALYSSSGSYRPQEIWNGGNGDLDAAVLKLDEKVALLAELWDGQLFSPVSDDSVQHRLSHIQSWLTLHYGRCYPVLVMAIMAFAAAISLILSSICHKEKSAGRILFRFLPLLPVWGIVTFAWHWIESGDAPLACSSDIMFFTAVIVAMICCIPHFRHDSLATALGLASCGALAMVAYLGSRNPQLTPLMPVLASPWLSVHVSLVMTAYALLSFASVAAIAAIPGSNSRRGSICAMSLRLTRWGVYLLGLGIWAGAMWANISWGRYWNWDPKETWALVTMILYAIPLHRSLGLSLERHVLCIYFALASLSILMTYAGVNYLPSLHAYR